MKLSKDRILLYIVYSFIIFIIYLFLVSFGQVKLLKGLIERTEFNLFDIRQEIIYGYKTPENKIVIADVDDATYEYVMDKFGSWPISRKIWGNIINNSADAGAKYLIFDLLFLKPDLKDTAGDNYFINSVKNHKNVYLSINFDNYSDEIRTPPELKESFKLKIKNGELKDSPYNTFINARNIMAGLEDAASNVGAVNATREEDGIIREVAPIFKYKDAYYPHLSLLPALDYLEKKEVSIENNSIIIDENHIIPLDNNRAIINWYGKRHTYNHVPLWKIIKAIKEGDNSYLNNSFKDKIVYFGTSATSLSDVKSTPIESNMSGVEIHANFLNNIIENNFIKKVDSKVDIIISLILSLIVGYCVLKTESTIKNFLFLILIIISYFIVSCVMMGKYNLWISLILPYISVIITFIFVYCEKYLLKSKDYEETYKLAVTDGLTQLYNHRYFQEQMLNYSNNFKTSGQIFSLILIDIDFFKKFNDTYGHQSGDIVLIQVSNIIKKNSRSTDIVARYGGEEMAVILPNAGQEVAVQTAKRICKAVENTTLTLAHGEKVNVTISLGVATADNTTKEAQEIISFSDKCLYKAKEQGRNQVVYCL